MTEEVPGDVSLAVQVTAVLPKYLAVGKMQYDLDVLVVLETVMYLCQVVDLVGLDFEKVNVLTLA